MATDSPRSPRLASEHAPALDAARRGRAGTATLLAASLVAHALALAVAVTVSVSLVALLPDGAVGLVGFLSLGVGTVAAAPALARRAVAALDAWSLNL